MSIVEQEVAGEVLSPAVRTGLEGLEATVAMLQERIRELEARLAQNSTNSSKPPSSDPPGVVRLGKKPKGKKRGGQPGHRGHHRMVLPPERVEKVEHVPEACEHCGHDLAGAEEGRPVQVHQVVELPPIRAEVKEHRMACLRCPKCSKLTRAPLPAEVGGKHFGPRLTALAGLLAGHFRMSRRSVVDLLGRLLDVPAPSLGSTEACTQETSVALEAAYREAHAEVRSGSWAGVDETPWKLCGKRIWLWAGGGGSGNGVPPGPRPGGGGVEDVSGRLQGNRQQRPLVCIPDLRAPAALLGSPAEELQKLWLRGGKAAEFAAKGEVSGNNKPLALLTLRETHSFP